MTTLANSFVSVPNQRNQLFSGSLMQADQCLGSTNLCIGHSGTTKLKKHRKSLIVRAGTNDDRLGGASLFVGGFVLGGIVVGTLGAIYAPQISKALAGADRKDLMRKLPKFIYDEEKALEKTRKILTDKIAQLNSAIDDVSAQLRADDPPNGSSVTTNGVEASSY
ncbi:uncharacterized protein LOC112513715 isoform X1 [Cynara cardunculus var. scolymus]|uniref:uncharacterized protein LOC112513715 isoform X1 n=1 Tax=Cynara cardunculus var. scolymus TaxID=59895 RepID=UPI000D6284FD|nr:uncharacterized protein LOC112513715 isoform X1 [Cynara cardunculus var. scolymus]